VRRRELLRRISDLAAAGGEEVLLVEGAKHSKVSVGQVTLVVPHHREINEFTAQAILRSLEQKLGGANEQS
jgi:hypothetical protein